MLLPVTRIARVTEASETLPIWAALGNLGNETKGDVMNMVKLSDGHFMDEALFRDLTRPRSQSHGREGQYHRDSQTQRRKRGNPARRKKA